MSENEGGVSKEDVPPEKVNGTEGSTGNTPTPGAAEDSGPAPPVSRPKYRYDWYQTEADVCINILVKKVKKENVNVDFQEKSVRGILKCDCS